MARRPDWTLIPWVLIGIFPIAAAAAPAADRGPQAAVVVTGRVVHGETSRPVAGVDVSVLGMESGQEPIERVTRSGEDGRFTLRMDASRRAYVIQAQYRGVVYTSGPHAPDGGVVRATLRVYETTDDASGLYIARRAILIEQGAPGAFDVREVVVVGNALPRTYVGQPEGDRRATLRLPLPAGAQDVSVHQGMVPLGQDPEGALVDSLPVVPGQRQIVLTYRLPVRGTTVGLAVPVRQPTLALDVFVAAPLTAHSDSLPQREERTVQGRRVLRLAGSNLAPPTAAELRVLGVTDPSPPWLPAIGTAALVLLVVCAATLPWLRGGRSARSPTPDRSPPDRSTEA